MLVNTAVGRLKERNVRRDPRVALAFVDPVEPYTWAEIRGRVVESVAGEQGRQSADRFANRYLGLERYVGPPGDERILLRIEPTYVNFKTEKGSDPEALRARLEAEK